MDGKADFAAPVHLGSFAVELRDLYFWRSCGVGGRDVKLPVELVLDELVHIPALARPMSAILVGGDCEPVRVRLLVQLDVLDQRLELLPQTW